MKREHALVIILTLFSICSVVWSASPQFGTVPNPPGANYVWDATNSVWRATEGNASGVASVNAAVTGAVSATLPGRPTGVATDPVNVTGSITATATVDFPAASATESAPSDALPVMLYANDNSSLQRLFTAIVQGDGVNGNNMLPQAGYVYNGSTFDRAQAKYDRVVSAVNANIDSVATDTATIISTIASITPPCTVQISCPAGQIWYAPGLATTTISSIKYHVLDEFQSVTFDVATSTWDISVGGVDAVSSCSVTVHSTVQ